MTLRSHRPVMRILIADDEPSVRHLLERALTRLGHDVVAAVGTGTELMEQLPSARPDLVTLDLELPGGDVHSLARTVLAQRPAAIVVISGRADLVPPSD